MVACWVGGQALTFYRFLWIFFQLRDLSETVSESQIRETLQNLPRGMNETYRRILAKIEGNPRHKELAIKIFQWLACARRPLSIEEMREAVAFGESDVRWDSAKIPAADIITGACHGLVIIDNERNSPCFAHYTVRQYLVRDEEIGLGTAAFCFYQMHAEEMVGKLCIAYLRFEDFVTEVARRSDNLRFASSGILGPGGAGTIPSVLGLGKPILDVTYRVLGSKSRKNAVDVDFGRYLNLRARPQKDDMPTGKYALKDYAVEQWAWHTRRQIFHASEILPKFKDLVLSRHLPFEFRPWGANRHYGPYGCNACPGTPANMHSPQSLPFSSLIHWAAQHGHLPLLRAALDGASPETLASNHFLHEIHSQETMLIACRSDNKAVLRHLLDANPFDMPWDLFLRTAATSGCVRNVELLLLRDQLYIHEAIRMVARIALKRDDIALASFIYKEWMHRDSSFFSNGFSEVSATGSRHLLMDDENNSFLHIAASDDRAEIIEALIQAGADIEAKNKDLDTPLATAVKSGSSGCVERLLAHRANINTHIYSQPLRDKILPRMDISRYDLFEYAAAMGHVSVFGSLLGSPDDEHRYFIAWVIYIAVCCGQSGILNFMSARDISFNSMDHTGNTAAHLALEFASDNGSLTDDLNALNVLNVDWNLQNEDGLTPLHLAAARADGHKLVETLLTFNIEPKMLSGSRQSALEIAEQKEYKSTVEVLCSFESAQSERPWLWNLKRNPFQGRRFDRPPYTWVKPTVVNEADRKYAIVVAAILFHSELRTSQIGESYLFLLKRRLMGISREATDSDRTVMSTLIDGMFAKFARAKTTSFSRVRELDAKIQEVERMALAIRLPTWDS